jgi:hypothetical protein
MLCEERVSVQLGKHHFPFSPLLFLASSPSSFPFTLMNFVSIILWVADLKNRFSSFLLCRPIVVVELPSQGLPHDEERRGRRVYDDDRVE